jgi:hypothetical protein
MTSLTALIAAVRAFLMGWFQPPGDVVQTGQLRLPDGELDQALHHAATVGGG